MDYCEKPTLIIDQIAPDVVFSEVKEALHNAFNKLYLYKCLIKSALNVTKKEKEDLL